MQATLTRELEEDPPKWVGQPLLRKEDARLVTGRGTFTDDVSLPNTAYMVLVRSPYPRAKVVTIDTSRAMSQPGVSAVLTGRDVAAEINPFHSFLLPPPYDSIPDYGIAVSTTHYSGEPVAVVLAKDRYVAEDAADLVDVEYESLPMVLSAEQGLLPSSPLVHDGFPSNVAWHRRFTFGDTALAFESADLVVSEKLLWHRFTSAPLEPNTVLADYDAGQDSFTIWSNNQRPAATQLAIAGALKMPSSRVRIVAGDIGGGFGIKSSNYPYMTLAALGSRKVNRPVKWVETRHEHMQASAHGQEVTYYGEMAFSRDGTILGYRGKAIHDEGAYMRPGPIGASNFVRQASLTYKFKNLEMDVYSVLTNKCPVAANRSYGKQQQSYLIERLIDIGARRLGVDPIELRYRNFVSPAEMPYEMPTGGILDGGDYPRAMSKLLEMMDYEELRRRRQALREQGRLAGIGVAMGMDSSPKNGIMNRVINPAAETSGETEAAFVKIDPSGGVLVALGTTPQGQGHETSVCQIVSDILSSRPADVRVLSGFDSFVNPSTPDSGTYASRFAVSGVGAVVGAASKIREKLLRIASHNMKSAIGDLRLRDGTVVSQTDGRSLTIRDIARIAWSDSSRLPPNEEPGLMEYFVYSVPFSSNRNFSLTYSYSCSLVFLEIDAETGRIDVKRIGLVEDCGNQINPMIVEGQSHGQIAHQLGAALYESLIYDDEGQLLTASFQDYLAPSASDLPPFEVGSIIIPSLFTPLGTRGSGEGGGAPLLACVNAVADALAPLGVNINTSYMDPVRLHQMIHRMGSS